MQRALVRVAARLSPGLGSTWSEPLWTAGAFALTVPLLRHLLEEGPGGLSPGGALLAGLTALVLMVTRERVMANVAVALLAGVLVAAVPPPWSPAVLSGTGLVLCMVGTWLDERDLDVGAALHHAGWVLSLLAVFGLRDLRHPGTAACFVAGLGSAWAVVYRRREQEMVGWVATLVAVHALMAHVGAVLSTGRGPQLILPVFGALSALLAAVALQLAGERVRRHVGHGFATLALVEVLGSLVLVPGSMGALRESLLACGGLTVLFFALVRRAVREEDEGSAFLAQGALSLGYLSVRLHALASELGGTDSLVALGGGVVFSGLYVFAQREGRGCPPSAGRRCGAPSSSPWRVCSPRRGTSPCTWPPCWWATRPTSPRWPRTPRSAGWARSSRRRPSTRRCCSCGWARGRASRSTTSSPWDSPCWCCCGSSGTRSSRTPGRSCERSPSPSSTWRGPGSRSCSRTAGPCCCVSCCAWWGWGWGWRCASAPMSTWAVPSW
ncbi:hypothetical protein ACN28S_49300 [Cystobacter fuscus]